MKIRRKYQLTKIDKKLITKKFKEQFKDFPEFVNVLNALTGNQKRGIGDMSSEELDKALRTAGFHWSSTIIWAKDTLVLSRKDYHTQYEPIWYGWKSDAARIWTVQDRKQSDLWQCDRPKRSDLHPTTKPVELIERAVLNSSNQGVIVFEPFGGSGSTLIACEKTGRKNRSMELDPKYCDVIVKRWEDFTGKKAELWGL